MLTPRSVYRDGERIDYGEKVVILCSVLEEAQWCRFRQLYSAVEDELP